jgi:uncharacterized protein YuzE
MKLKYDRDADVLTMELSDKSIDHAEEAGPMIIHLTDDNKPVLIEILDASEFLANLTKISIKSPSETAAKAGT